MDSLQYTKQKLNEVVESATETARKTGEGALDKANDVARKGGDAATKAAKRASETLREVADSDVGELTHNVSAQLERTISKEPVNSLMRSITLGLAGGFALSSIALYAMGRKHESLLAGQAVAPLLSIALWDQIVKGQRYQPR